jgi:hypothetical protein
MMLRPVRAFAVRLDRERRAVVCTLGCSARSAGPSPTATQPIAELASDLPIGVTLGDCLPLVKGPPAACQADLHLRPAVLEVQRQRHERDAGVAQPPGDLVDLAAVQEQLAGATGLVQRAGAVAAVGVLGDVQAVEHQLAVVLLDERVDQRRVASAQGFHLIADQDDPGLVCLEDRVVVPGPPVRGDEPAAWFPGRGALLVIQSVNPAGGAGHAAAWADIQNVPGEWLGELLLLIGPGRRRRRSWHQATYWCRSSS